MKPSFPAYYIHTFFYQKKVKCKLFLGEKFFFFTLHFFLYYTERSIFYTKCLLDVYRNLETCVVSSTSYLFPRGEFLDLFEWLRFFFCQFKSVIDNFFLTLVDYWVYFDWLVIRRQSFREKWLCLR